MEEIKNVWKYGYYVKGIKKRDRKAKNHSEKFAEVETVDVDNLIAQARQQIQKDFKSVISAHATATFFVIKTDDIGTVEHWEPFTKEHNLSFPIELTL